MKRKRPVIIGVMGGHKGDRTQVISTVFDLEFSNFIATFLWGDGGGLPGPKFLTHQKAQEGLNEKG